MFFFITLLIETKHTQETKYSDNFSGLHLHSEREKIYNKNVTKRNNHLIFCSINFLLNTNPRPGAIFRINA